MMLSDEQKQFIIEIIDIWYLKWKTRMTNQNEKGIWPLHNLGFAKEELKQMVWDLSKEVTEFTSINDWLDKHS